VFSACSWSDLLCIILRTLRQLPVFRNAVGKTLPEAGGAHLISISRNEDSFGLHPALTPAEFRDVLPSHEFNY
jgi:hypothetical protein